MQKDLIKKMINSKIFIAFAVLLFFVFIVQLIKHNIEKPYANTGAKITYTFFPRDEAVKKPTITKAKPCSTKKLNKCHKEVYLFQGQITTIDDIQAELDGILTSQIKTICFDSNGGTVTTGIEIARWILDKKFNTCIAEFYSFTENGETKFKKSKLGCSSTCPYVFLSGKSRVKYGKNVNLKFHQFSTPLNDKVRFFSFIEMNIKMFIPDATSRFADIPMTGSDRNVYTSEELNNEWIALFNGLKTKTSIQKLLTWANSVPFTETQFLESSGLTETQLMTVIN